MDRLDWIPAFCGKDLVVGRTLSWVFSTRVRQLSGCAFYEKNSNFLKTNALRPHADVLEILKSDRNSDWSE